VSLSADGSRLAVSAPYEQSRAVGVNGNEVDNSVIQAGATYVFVRSGSVWTQEAYIKPSNTGGEDYFGESLSLSGDGTRLVVGPPQKTRPGPVSTAPTLSRLSRVARRTCSRARGRRGCRRRT